VERTEITTYEDLATRIPAKELSTLLKVSSSLASTMDLAQVLQIAIENSTNILELETGAIYTIENRELYLGATTPPLPSQFPDELRLTKLCDHPHLSKAVTSKAPVFLEDARVVVLSPAEKIIVETRQLISVLYFPLFLKEEVIGAFILGSTNAVRGFTSNEIDLCYILSYQVSFAIANALLYKKAQQSIADLSRAYDTTLEGWSQVLDMRDHITEEHTLRVVDLSLALASRMGVPDADLGHVRRGALLHDIGKMAIPDAILQKPDVLTDAEKKIMQTHPEKARRILERIDYLTPALDIPSYHHEKWDGSGYPRNLAGEAIPLNARVFAVIDVYDALTSNRPYRSAWSKQEALDYIVAQSGKHFDPAVVQAFLEMVI